MYKSKDLQDFKREFTTTKLQTQGWQIDLTDHYFKTTK